MSEESPRAGWSAVPGGTLQATKLLRVVPIAQSCAVEGGELTVASIELYEDGCILHCHVIPSDDAPPRFEPGQGQGYRVSTARMEGPGLRNAPVPLPRSPALPDDRFRLRLEDDAGTRYAGGARAGGGNNLRWETSYGFTPAVPDAATALRLFVHPAPSPPGSAAIHVFEIPL